MALWLPRLPSCKDAYRTACLGAVLCARSACLPWGGLWGMHGGALGAWIVAVAICLMVGDATAAGWRSANFRVYSGDYNGDGQPDLYLKAVTSVVVVGGEVATPIPLLPPLKNVVLLRNGAS